jgi:hypothetical protein
VEDSEVVREVSTEESEAEEADGEPEKGSTADAET